MSNHLLKYSMPQIIQGLLKPVSNAEQLLGQEDKQFPFVILQLPLPVSLSFLQHMIAFC